MTRINADISELSELGYNYRLARRQSRSTGSRKGRHQSLTTR